ncbi:DUF1382 family protein [Escherichia coli]
MYLTVPPIFISRLITHSLAQIGVRFVPIPVETDEEFHTLAASLSQKLEMMVAKAEADERDQV